MTSKLSSTSDSKDFSTWLTLLIACSATLLFFPYYLQCQIWRFSTHKVNTHSSLCWTEIWILTENCYIRSHFGYQLYTVPGDIAVNKKLKVHLRITEVVLLHSKLYPKIFDSRVPLGCRYSGTGHQAFPISKQNISFSSCYKK